jgi:hypothetical protein
MYKLRWWDTGEILRVRFFPTLQEAVHYSIYKTPYESMYGIDKV